MKAGERVRGRRQVRPGRIWLVLLSLAALFVGGCGGGDASSSTAAGADGALTKAELIEAGDAICAKVYPVEQTADPKGTPQEVHRVADPISGMAKQLLALGTPQETDYAYAEYLTALHVVDRTSDKVKTMVKRGELDALQRADKSFMGALGTFQGYASQYGFKDCAENNG